MLSSAEYFQNTVWILPKLMIFSGGMKQKVLCKLKKVMLSLIGPTFFSLQTNPKATKNYGKYRKYFIEALSLNKVPVRETVLLFGVPVQTLCDRVKLEK